MTQTAGNYARVLFELSVPEQALFEAESLLREESRLMEALKNPTVSLAEKERAADRIFPEETRSFIKTVCRHGNAGLLFEIFDAYRAYAKEQRGILSAVLTYVTPPTKEQLHGLSEFLKRRFGKREVEFELTEDKTLLGGFVLRAGSFEYDRSLKGSYRRLSNYLYGGERA